METFHNYLQSLIQLSSNFTILSSANIYQELQVEEVYRTINETLHTIILKISHQDWDMLVQYNGYIEYHHFPEWEDYQIIDFISKEQYEYN
jgi:hypothetical protein